MVWKTVIVGVVCGGVGLLSGVFIEHKRVEKKHLTDAESTRQYYEKLYSEEIKALKEKLGENIESDTNNVGPENTQKNDQLKYTTLATAYGPSDQSHVDYSAYSASNKKTTSTAPVADVNAVSPTPILVSAEEFDENLRQYYQEDLTYYMKDCTLANALDKVINNDEECLIGPDALDHFGYIKSYPNRIFVRNDEMRTYFVVDRIDESYDGMIDN